MGRGGGEDDPREWPLGAVGWGGRGVVLADRLIGGDLTHDLFRFWMKVVFQSAIQSALAQGDVKGQGGVVMGSCAWCVWGAGGRGGCVAICGDVDLVRGAGSGWGAWERGEPVAAGGVGGTMATEADVVSGGRALPTVCCGVSAGAASVGTGSLGTGFLGTTVSVGSESMGTAFLGTASVGTAALGTDTTCFSSPMESDGKASNESNP